MKKKATASTNSWNVVFVQCELDKNTKEQVKNWDVKGTATFDGMDRLIADGYKVSFAHDTYHDCVGVFCTMPDKTAKNAGQCLTARGPDWISAMKVLVYKHFTVLGEDWGTPVAQERSRDEWG